MTWEEATLLERFSCLKEIETREMPPHTPLHLEVMLADVMPKASRAIL